ncbi:hypothetical protein CEXT_734171 [Caerostris extrusa]|uniref:Uncharacterized protein n=1 Tax=Caerostris extrusa TaxID=172846 RepID=A0AAV4MJ07_CAEEX|nr:hypothetical protein CEXT_734171 [Caerostris extrusa]
MGQWSTEKVSAKDTPEARIVGSMERSSIKDLQARRKTLSTITHWDTKKEPTTEDREEAEKTLSTMGSWEHGKKVPSSEHRGSISKVPLGQDRASIERSSVKDLLSRRKTLSTITQWDTKKEPTKDYRSGAEKDVEHSGLLECRESVF